MTAPDYSAMSRATLEHHAGWLAKRLTDMTRDRDVTHEALLTKMDMVEAAAYRRAAAVCRAKAVRVYDHAKGPYLTCAEAIEALAPSAAQSVEEMRRIANEIYDRLDGEWNDDNCVCLNKRAEWEIVLRALGLTKTLRP